MGITAYILAYNKFPFQSENDSIFELYDKIYKGKYEIPEYPPRCKIIKNIIKHCLEKDPNKRITIETLSKHLFIDKDSSENIEKWNLNKKIPIFKKEMINSINFFCPNCVAIYKVCDNSRKKIINTGKLKYKKFKGKIFNFCEKLKYNSIEDKYGVFVVDGLIFRKEDFGMKNYKDDIEEKKLKKKQMCKNYKKYKEEKLMEINL